MENIIKTSFYVGEYHGRDGTYPAVWIDRDVNGFLHRMSIAVYKTKDQAQDAASRLNGALVV